MNRKLGFRWLLTVALLASLGCGAAPDREPVEDSFSDWRTLDAHELLDSLEEGLLAEGVFVEFEVVAEGAFQADLAGTLRSEAGGTTVLEAAGTFGAESVTLSLSIQNGRMTGGSAERRFDEPVPGELREALVVGLTRMGILHNLARLVGGVPPDRADGGVRAWVEARDARWVAGNGETGEHGVAFDIRVADRPAGEATLWLNGNGHLVARDQIVRFPSGEMVVRERYSMGPEAREDP